VNKKLLIGIIVVFVIAAATFLPMFIAGASLVVWIYLVWMVREKRISLFHDQVEPKLAERRYKTLKAFLLVAGISFAVSIVGVILHGVLGALLEIEEEVVSFFIALVALYVFAAATISSLVMFLKGRSKTT
jgi:hypothetical protein